MNQTKVDVDIPIDKDFSKIINYKYCGQNSLCGAKEANLILSWVLTFEISVY